MPNRNMSTCVYLLICTESNVLHPPSFLPGGACRQGARVAATIRGGGAAGPPARGRGAGSQRAAAGTDSRAGGEPPSSPHQRVHS